MSAPLEPGYSEEQVNHYYSLGERYGFSDGVHEYLRRMGKSKKIINGIYYVSWDDIIFIRKNIIDKNRLTN